MGDGNLPAWPLAILLLVAALALIAWNLIAHRRDLQADLDPLERVFRRRQLRRRLQTSSMLGLLGLAIAIGATISHRQHPLGFVLFWCGVLCWLLWIVLLDLGDAWSSRRHFRRLEQREWDRIAQDRRQAIESRAYQGNGRRDSTAERHDP